MRDKMKTRFIKAATSDDNQLGFEVNRLRRMAKTLGKVYTFDDVMEQYHESAIELDTSDMNNVNTVVQRNRSSLTRNVLVVDSVHTFSKNNPFID